MMTTRSTMIDAVKKACIGVGAFFLLLFIWGDASAQTTFTDVSVQSGVRQVTPTWGACFVDFNNDGLDDIYTNNHHYYSRLAGVEIPGSLFLNNGNLTFTDIALASGLVVEGDLHGAVWGDFNNDGLKDLYQATGGGLGGSYLGRPNMLFKNMGGWSFIDIASTAGLSMPDGRGRGGFWVDYDYDGLLDLFVCNEKRLNNPAVLMRNNGNETFSTGAISVDRAHTGSPVDYNGDGIYDIFLVAQERLYVFLNNGNGTFTDVTAATGLSGVDFVQGFTWLDYDNDGDMDLFLTRASLLDSLKWDTAGIAFKAMTASNEEEGVDFQSPGGAATIDVYDYLWRVDPLKVYIGSQSVNPSAVPFALADGAAEAQGKPTYTLGIDTAYYVWQEQGVWHLRGTTKGTVKNDFLGGVITSTSPITAASHFGFDFISVGYTHRLYENMGNGTFTEVGAFAGVADLSNPSSLSVSAVSADFDNDGWTDIYVVNTGELGNAPDRLFMNNGNKTFTESSVASGVDGGTLGSGENAVTGDFDNDGFIDIFVMNGYGPAPFGFGPHLLYRNNGNGNNWLKVRLTGTMSNRDALGATIVASVGTATHTRQQNGAVSRYSQNSTTAHFGLGGANVVDTLAVKWPSGVVQTLTNVAAGQTSTLTEPSPAITLNPVTTVIAPGAQLVYTMTLDNPTNLSRTFDYWTNVTLPSGKKFPSKTEFIAPVSVTLAPYSSVTKTVKKTVPVGTPLGNYTYNGFAGPYTKAWSSSSFNFTVQ